jgi:periplasmic protein CpxP/Spy
MEKTKLLSILAVGMLLTNVVLLVFMFGKGQQQLPHKMPREIIIEELSFNETQILAYDELITIHRSKISNADMQLRKIKNDLYQLLNSNKAIEKERDSLIVAINDIQKEIEYIHFEHFKEIQNLCNDEQKIKFEALSKNLARLFGPPPPPLHKMH